MRLPRLQFTVRRTIVAVAVVAVLLHGQRVRHHRLVIAMLCGVADRGVRHTGASFRMDYDAESARVVRQGTPARTTSEIEGRRRRAAYWAALQRKYERAARYPWLPVEPDPPEPN